MSGKLHLICMKTEAKIRCNLNVTSVKRRKKNFQFLSKTDKLRNIYTVGRERGTYPSRNGKFTISKLKLSRLS